MHELRLDETLGTYYPGYFEIFVNTNKGVDLNKLNDRELATFFHEWIHFIQDFTTGVGCNNSYVMIETLKYIGKAAQNTAKTSGEPVAVPIPIGTDGNILANRFMMNNEWGSSPKDTSYTSVVDVKNTLKSVPSILNKSNIQIPICTLTTDKGETFEFGTKDIMEGMASLCQHYMFPDIDKDNIPAYPYKTVERVCSVMNPKIASDNLMMIALCEMSLMSSAPGAQFTSYLLNLKSGNIPQPQKPEDIYDWFYRADAKLLKGYKEINEYARLSFLGILRDPEIFKTYRYWINNAYEKAFEIRKNDRYFLLTLLRNGDLKNNKSFKELLSKFGSPLLRNNGNEFAKIPLTESEEWDVEYFQAIREVIEILLRGKYSCSLVKWCISTTKELLKKGIPVARIACPDERCLKNPPSRIFDSVRCPIAFLWYAMDLPQVQF